MPHLYLPSDHTDADLVLAADVAAAVSSSDLYVTWTLDSGAGSPEVEAVVREEHEPAQRGAFVDLFVALAQGIVALWSHLVAAPQPRPDAPHVPESGRRAAGEPSV
jgi:hypothetical protein